MMSIALGIPRGEKLLAINLMSTVKLSTNIMVGVYEGFKKKPSFKYEIEQLFMCVGNYVFVKPNKSAIINLNISLLTTIFIKVKYSVDTN